MFPPQRRGPMHPKHVMRLRLTTAACLAVALFACARQAAMPAAAATAATPAGAAVVAAAVESTYRAGIAAFNAHELDTFVGQFADDVVMYTPTGWLRGRAAVRARFDSTFRQFPKVRMEIDSLEVRAVGPATATVAFRWHVYPMGAGPAFDGVGSGVYVRRADAWVEVLEHETVTRIAPELQRR
jgi:uncharacterized protein (TIGR02246 family)